VSTPTIGNVDTSGLWPGKVVTEVVPPGPFWEAEPEHQDYLEHFPNGTPVTSHARDGPCRTGATPWRRKGRVSRNVRQTSRSNARIGARASGVEPFKQLTPVGEPETDRRHKAHREALPPDCSGSRPGVVLTQGSGSAGSNLEFRNISCRYRTGGRT
jgi:hypothetical protein